MSAKSLIVAVRANSPAVVASIIEQLCDQSLRNELLKVVPRSFLSRAFAEAVVQHKGGSKNDLYFVAMTEADMIMMRMLGLRAIAQADYIKFSNMTKHPDLAPFDHRRQLAATDRQKREANRQYQHVLEDLLYDIVE